MGEASTSGFTSRAGFASFTAWGKVVLEELLPVYLVLKEKKTPQSNGDERRPGCLEQAGGIDWSGIALQQARAAALPLV